MTGYINITASKLIKHITWLAGKYKADATSDGDKIAYKFNDSEGDTIEEFTLSKAEHPALIRLINKIINLKQGDKNGKSNSN